MQTAPANTAEPWTSGAVALNEGADRAEDNRGEEERKHCEECEGAAIVSAPGGDPTGNPPAMTPHRFD